MIDAESHWSRVDDVSGEPVDRYGVDLALVADKELVPNRIVAAFNLIYLPEIALASERDMVAAGDDWCSNRTHGANWPRSFRWDRS